MLRRPFSIALRTALLYALIAALWVLVSDQALALFVSSPQWLTTLQTYKGWAYVGVTSLLLYTFLHRQFFALEHYAIERKQKEESLRQSEYRYRMLFEQNNDAIFLIGLDRVHFMANQRAAEMFGYSVDELVGMNIRQLVAPEALEQTHNVMNRLLAKEKIPIYERLFVKKDGTRLVAEVNVDMVRDLHGNPLHIQSICHDITERKRAEAASQQSQAQLAGIVTSAMDAVISIDAEQRIVLFNPSAETVFRCAAAEAIGQPLEKFIPERFRASHAQHVRDFASSGITNRSLGKLGTVVGLRSDGVEFPIEASISQTHIANGDLYTVILRDITERVQAENALRESEQRYRVVVENALVGMFITGVRGEIVYLNEAARKIIEYDSVEEMISLNAAAFYKNPHDRKVFTEQLLRTGRVDNFEAEVLTKTGKTKTVSMYATLQGNTITGLVIDNTERMRAEEALRESEERYRDLVENSHDLICTHDLDGKLLSVNEVSAKLSGYSRESLLQMNLADLLSPRTRDQFGDYLTEIQTRRQARGIMQVRTASGDTLYWEYDNTLRTEGVTIPIVRGMARDVTARVQAEYQAAKSEAKLLESESRFRNLVETTTDWIWEIDEHSVYIYASPRIRDILGYEPAEIIGKSPADLMLPDEAKRVTDIFLPIRAARSPFSNLENINLHKDGHLVALETSGIPILDKDGKFCGYRGIDRDITERKQAEESERQHNRQINFLYEAGQRLNRTLDLDDIYQTILEFLSTIVSCDSLAISAFDADTQLITCRAMWVDGKQQDVSAFPAIPLEPRGQGTQSVAIRMAHSLLFNDYQARVKTSQSSHYVSQDGVMVDDVPPEADIPRSAMIVPLLLAGKVVGVIQVFSYQLNAYTDTQLKILESLASHIASAQQNALLYTERVRAEQQAATSEAKMHALFSAMRDVVLTIDKDGIYREIAPTNPGLLIRPPHELLGQSLTDVFLPLQAEEFLTVTRQVLATQQIKYIEYDLTIGGKSVWFSTAITPMSSDATVWVARDITERKLAETRIQLQIDRLSALRVIDQAISSSFDLRVTLSIFLNQVTSQLRADAAAILMLNPQLQTLQYSAGSGFRTKAVERTQLHLGDSYAGRAVLERQMISASQSAAGHDSRFAALKVAEGFTTYFCLPLITKGNVVGVLEIFHRASFESDSEWLSFLEMLAAQAAIAIDNANLFQNLQRSNIDLMLAYDTTLEGWSRALDMRDKETEGHSQRVTALTLQLARALELSEEAILHIRRGALLHDIGKMGVPDSILLKPDKLTDEEWELMRRHPQLAVDFLSPIVYLRPALDIPYCHHEKWDGTGYPRGLKDEQIPLAARIFAIADVWDALRSDRPYRAGWSAHKTRDHIKSLSGTHLDPKVVAVFLTQLQL